MKILFCLNGPNELNGPNVWLMRHLPLLRERGLEVELLYLSLENTGTCRYRTFFENQGFRVRTAAMQGFVEDRAEAVVRALAGDLPDVFVPNYSVPAYYAARFLKEAGVLTIGTIHSDDPYYHDLIDYFVTGPPRWRLSAVVGVSDFITELMSSKDNLDIPYLHASYGAPVPKRSAQWREGSLQLVYTGRLVELQKRIGRLTQRLLSAATQFPSVEATLYGAGSESSRVNCLIKESGEGCRVRLGGELSPDQITDVLLNGQVFVLLSEFEGLSISLMEAMACGVVPVISRMSSGTTDLIESGRNGFIVDADDPDEFNAVIGTMAQDKTLWERLSRAARATIVNNGYTPECCADKWVDFIDNISEDKVVGSVVFPPLEGWLLPQESQRYDGLKYLENRSSKADILRSGVDGRPLFLWGAGNAGINLLRAIKQNNTPICGFIDSDPEKKKITIEGVRVFSTEILDNPAANDKPFVVITSSYGHEIRKTLIAKGYLENTDFI